MKEKILEIIRRETGIIAPDAVTEIVAFVEQHYYPKEFVGWLTSPHNIHIHKCGTGWRILEYKGDEYFIERSVAEVYQYWLTQIKK
jgi:hypothetical protein